MGTRVVGVRLVGVRLVGVSLGGTDFLETGGSDFLGGLYPDFLFFLLTSLPRMKISLPDTDVSLTGVSLTRVSVAGTVGNVRDSPSEALVVMISKADDD